MARNPRQMLLTIPIKRYLLHCVAKAGAEPELLMGELELCDKFGVSRVTVRRAIDELIQAGYIIRLPKRRGAFSNPEMAMDVPRCVGIVSGQGANVCDGVSGLLVSGFLRRMSGSLCEISFIALDGRRAAEADLQIANIGLDGVFWLEPDEMWLEAINRLLGRGFPLVAIASPYSAFYRQPQSNCIGFDFASVGVKRAEFFIKCGCRNIVYCGQGNQTFDRFVSTLKAAGIEHDRSCLLETVGEVGKGLPRLLESGMVDGLVADGSYNRLRAIFDVAQAHPRSDKISFLIDWMPSLREFLSKYPSLNVTVGGVWPYQKAGELAADWLLKLMSGKCDSFTPTVLIRKNTPRKHSE